MIRATCCSHIGKRINYEDNYFLDGNYVSSELQQQMLERRMICFETTSSARIQYFAVSDGMGGHNAGEFASRVCMEKLDSLSCRVQSCNSLKETVLLFQTAINEINQYVCEISCDNSDLKGMGATLVLIIVYESEYAVLNIGDSRAYYFENDRLIQITKDNTEGQRILDLGLLSRKELESFPARKNLNRYIGYGQKGYILRADEYYPNVKKGILMLCSDGISDALSDRQISSILRTENSASYIEKRLVEEAVSAYNADNATVILLRG